MMSTVIDFESGVLRRPIEVKVLNTSNLPLPELATKGSAAYDLYSTEEGYIARGETKLIQTGLYLEIPEGWEVQIFPRSGMSVKKGMMVPNSPGLVDPDFRGQIVVGLYNREPTTFHYKVGDRIAQMKIVPSYHIKWVPVDSVDKLSVTDRGAGGFGSTGGVSG